MGGCKCLHFIRSLMLNLSVSSAVQQSSPIWQDRVGAVSQESSKSPVLVSRFDPEYWKKGIFYILPWKEETKVTWSITGTIQKFVSITVRVVPEWEQVLQVLSTEMKLSTRSRFERRGSRCRQIHQASSQPLLGYLPLKDLLLNRASRDEAVHLDGLLLPVAPHPCHGWKKT